MVKLISFLIALLLLSGHTQSQQKSEGPVEGKKIDKLIELTGTDSTNLKTEFLRCSHWPEWQQIWRRHREGKSPVQLNQMLKFDLKSHMVLAVFQGYCGHHEDVWFHEIEEYNDHLRVRFVINHVQRIEDWNLPPRETVRPFKYEGGSYGFVVIPKSKKQIRFESGSKSLVAEPFTWKEVAILPAITE